MARALDEKAIINEAAFEEEYKLLSETGIKENSLRREYEQKVAALKGLAAELEAQGLSDAAVAKTLHDKRRSIGMEYKKAALPLFREYIYYATAKKYGDPFGPTYEELRKRKTDREIISSACRAIEDLDNRLTLDGFRVWFEEKKRQSAFHKKAENNDDV